MPDDQEADTIRAAAIFLGVYLCLYSARDASEDVQASEVEQMRHTVGDRRHKSIDRYGTIEDHFGLHGLLSHKITEISS